MKSILVTGSSGLVGSEVCTYFHDRGYRVHGVDNNQRAVFFGEQGDTRWNQKRLITTLKHFEHHELDVRDRAGIMHLLAKAKPTVIVHAAAQTSHDRAASIPFADFDTNAVGTLNLLEAARQSCPESPFIHMSTNKVYGDAPNRIKLKELDTRWDFDDPLYENGIDETFSIDQSMHSLFGASKLASDILSQEYGRYFTMPTCVLRGGCLTGPYQAGVELHGFLSYLVKCNLERREYTIYGYKGKQVRDNLHSFDVASMIHEFAQSPKTGEVYNLGGGKENSCSVIEAIRLIESITGIPQKFSYVPENRIGDHICYYSNLSKIRSHFPEWNVSKPLQQIIVEIAETIKSRRQ